MAARRRRGRPSNATKEAAAKIVEQRLAVPTPDATDQRDPDAYTYADLAQPTATAAAEADARIKFLTARIDNDAAERENLARFTHYAARALGVTQEPQEATKDETGEHATAQKAAQAASDAPGFGGRWVFITT